METSGVQLFVRSRLCVAANTQHDQRWNSGMLFLAALVFQLGVSCNSGGTAAQPDRESPKPRGLALATSGVAPADVMGFETAGAWSTTTVGAVLAQSSTHSQGASSLSVRPSNKNGYTPIASVPLTTLSGVSTALALDIMLPTQQPNPRWLGTVQMYLNCPSRSIFSQFLAQAELTGKPLNVWNTISFPLTNAQVSGLLSAGYSDLTITIVLNVQVPTTGTYFIDNLRFVPVAANACGGKPNGTACTDGNACTLGDTCQSGSCRPGTPTVCPSPDQCHTTASCNPATGLCSNPAKADGSACSDGNACTQTDTCQSGRCVVATPRFVACLTSAMSLESAIPQRASARIRRKQTEALATMAMRVHKQTPATAEVAWAETRRSARRSTSAMSLESAIPRPASARIRRKQTEALATTAMPAHRRTSVKAEVAWVAMPRCVRRSTSAILPGSAMPRRAPARIR